MSNSYLTNAARIAGMGNDQGLSLEQTAEALIEKRNKLKRHALQGNDRRAADAFDMAAAGVPAELQGFGYADLGANVEFGVDQADWQMAAADDKQIEAKIRRRDQQAVADVMLDNAIRNGSVKERNAAMAMLEEARNREQNPDGRTDWRMQRGERIKEDPFLVGKRGPDQNLIDVPEKEVRFMGRVDRDRKGNFLRVRHPHREVLEREPQVPLGFEQPDERNRRQQMEIEAERGQVRALRAQAGEREAGIYREGDIRKMIRDFEVMENVNAGVPGMAANQPFVGPLQNNGDVEALRRRVIQDRLDNPMRQLDLPVRQAFNSAADIQEEIIRQEVAGRAVNGEANLLMRQLRNAARAGAPIDPVIQEQLNRLPSIKDVGHLKQKLPVKAGGFNEGQFFPEAARNDIDVFAPYGTNNQGAYFDVNGNPLGVQGPTPANSVDPGQVANAPRDVRQWAIQNAPDYKQGGRIFGDFPQVDIGGAGNDFLARIAKIKAKGQAFDPGISAIRNIDDLQGVVDRFGDFQQAGGLKAFHLDANNKEVYVDRAGLPEIFQKMKVNANGQGRLANALFQLEAAKANGVNNEQRVLFEKGLDQFGNRGKFADIFAPNLVNGGPGVENIRIPQAQVIFGAQLPEFGNDEAQLQKIPRGDIQIGVDRNGNAIKQDKMAALQGLRGDRAFPPLDANELRDARNGLVGLVQGEGRGRNYGFANPIPKDVDPMAFFKAQAVERAKPGKQPNFARVRDNVNRRQGVIDRKEAAEVELGAKRRQLAIDKIVAGGGPNRPANRGLQRNMDPGTESGGMGGGTRPPSVVAAASPDPWQTPPGKGYGANLGVQQGPLRNGRPEGGQQGPIQGPGRERSLGERRDFAINKIKGYATSPRFQTGRRRAYGVGGAVAGLAGISSLIGGERDRREQEAQY